MGPTVGAPVVCVGDIVGMEVEKVGASLGGADGGVSVGALVGISVVTVGEVVGIIDVPGGVGASEGAYVGFVGALVGDLVGAKVGFFDGDALGTEGEVVGLHVV